MTKPVAYEPEAGYKYQIFCRFDTPAWEHCDYAASSEEKKKLLEEYRMAFGAGWEFQAIRLPRKYWPKQLAAGGAHLIRAGEATQ